MKEATKRLVLETLLALDEETKALAYDRALTAATPPYTVIPCPEIELGPGEVVNGIVELAPSVSEIGVRWRTACDEYLMATDGIRAATAEQVDAWLDKLACELASMATAVEATEATA